MRYKILSLCSKEYAPLAEVTWPGKQSYADWHGYTAVNITPETGDHYGFQKLQLLINDIVAGDYDWVIWMGADVLITNPNIELSEIANQAKGADLIIATDAHGINTDVMMVRQTDRVASFLKLVLDSRRHYEPMLLGEQQAMSDLLPFFPGFARIVPQRKLNAYDYKTLAFLGGKYAEATDQLGTSGQWMPGDFVIHFPGLPFERRLELARHYAKM